MSPDGTTTTTTRLTGIVDRSVVPARTGCVNYMGSTCTHVGTWVPYRALKSVALTFSGPTRTQYETAATAGLAPTPAGIDKFRFKVPDNDWSTSEGALP
jgi:hypothetical protein